MKQTIIKYRFLLSILYLVAILFTLATSIKVNYTLIAPGYNYNIKDFIIIEDGYEESGSFSTTSVIVIYDIPWIQKLFASSLNTITMYEKPTVYQNTTTKDLNYRSLVMKNDSLAKSIIVAFEKANIDITYQTEFLISTIYDYLEEDTLELGDQIITLNGEPYDGLPPLTCGDTLEFVVLRDDLERTFEVPVQDIDGYCKTGVNITELTTIISTSKQYTLVDTNTGGPSGGLMQSLYIFNELTEYDYTKGLYIAGTGTIELDGSVGPIGGVEQKIITSVLNGIDLFFVPTANYDKAKETLDTLQTDMILIKVETIDDCIAYLEGYNK